MGRKKTEEEKTRQREFGHRVWSLRDEQRLSQDDVMSMGGLERSFISNVENGIHSISSDRIYDLAAGLRVDTVDLFEPEQTSAPARNTTDVPRYLQLADYISKEITSGLLRPGHPLGSESAMCYEYGYSRFASRKALTVLRQQGLIRTTGQENFVASEDDLQVVHLHPGDEVIVRMPTQDEAIQHGIAEGIPVSVRKSVTGQDEIYPADRFTLKVANTGA